VHINPDRFFETRDGRITTPERNAWAWQQRYLALERALSRSNPKSTPYLMIGVQGSGKSTWARKMVGGNPNAIIFDAIPVKRSERDSLLVMASRHRVPAVAVWCRAPLAACLERNAARPPDEMANEQGLRNVFAALELPVVAEGFSAIIEVVCSAA
jgi:hypothetical protein